MRFLDTFLSMSQQALTEPSLAIGSNKDLLAHDRQRASDSSLVAIYTTPSQRFI